MNSVKTLENNLFWQKHVLANSKDPKQKERVKLAIAKLQNEINRTKALG